ncbi:MAG: LacI family DNA-binding transcriptional regulator [Lachnospiraceae bacterium]|nr:LacI family DNA-binding transcriptional regulator [Lachnospiraceae bacterium]
MASLKDIAKQCKVSVATVSKALNDHTDISPETKSLILETAKEMGYHPNSQARALKTNRTYNLGVLFADESRSGLTHDYFASVLDSFKRTAEALGYDITFINNSSPKNMSYLEHTRYRGFDGVVLACIDFYDPAVSELLHSELPIVTIDHVFSDHTSICSDNFGGMRGLTEYIRSKGHKKIAYIYGDDTSVTKNRLNGFQSVIDQSGQPVEKEYILPSHYRNPEDAFRLTKHLLSLSRRPTCIIYPDDYSCIGGINALTEEGLRIPEDMSIAGYDGQFLSQIVSPKLTTYAQATSEIGKTAAYRLIQLIENPRPAVPEHVVVSGRVVEGESVASLISYTG